MVCLIYGFSNITSLMTFSAAAGSFSFDTSFQPRSSYYVTAACNNPWAMQTCSLHSAMTLRDHVGLNATLRCKEKYFS